jgi:hypothetical protein
MNKGKSTGSKTFTTILIVILFSGVCAWSDDFSPPSWRGNSGATFQQWSFSTDAKDQVLPDDGYTRPPDTYEPYLYVNSTYQYNGSDGAWPLGELDLFIPNFTNTSPGTFKQIQIQLTWQAANNNFMPPQPLIGVVSDFSSENPAQYTTTILPRQDFAPVNGWNRSLFLVDIKPNPLEEWIAIQGDIVVDQVVVDTYCGIPEPCTIALLGLGVIFGLKPKRGVRRE